MKGLSTVDRLDFRSLKGDVESFSRLCGYYLVDLVSIQELRDEVAVEDLLTLVFAHFDDQAWPPVDQRPTDQSWGDYETDLATARRTAVDALVGGFRVGHAVDTIPYETATVLWERFLALFPTSSTFYVGLGLGDPNYVFQQGVAIVSSDVAGLLWVVESD